uniref:Uncharacterized protein n=1 Tax=Haemonchus placei TaxID=6290 RepID=A0A0N4WA69_HAEPC
LECGVLRTWFCKVSLTVENRLNTKNDIIDKNLVKTNGTEE